jgi:hypothetical protein
MSWFGWTLIVLYTLSTVVNVLIIGQPRKPQTQGGAAAALLMNALIIIGIIYVGTGK